MNDNRVIKYENIKNESYKMVSFHKNGTIEHLLIHEFETDNGQDYLVVGKSTESIPSINKESAGWNQIIDSAVSRYKIHRDKLIKSNDNSYYDTANIPNFYFTKEGYDLVTHKFLFTNNEIIRTVNVGRQQKGNEFYYTNEYGFLDDNDFEHFRRLEFYENLYTLRDEEFQNLSIDNLSLFVNANFSKCKNVITLAIQEGVLHREVMEEFFLSGDNLEILQAMVAAIDAINTIREKKKNIGTIKK